MDANLLACPGHERLIEQLADSRSWVDFSQPHQKADASLRFSKLSWQGVLSIPAQFLHRLIVCKMLHGAENPLVVHPPLEMSGDGRRRGPLIDQR